MRQPTEIFVSTHSTIGFKILLPIALSVNTALLTKFPINPTKLPTIVKTARTQTTIAVIFIQPIAIPSRRLMVFNPAILATFFNIAFRIAITIIIKMNRTIKTSTLFTVCVNC